LIDLCDDYASSPDIYPLLTLHDSPINHVLPRLLKPHRDPVIPVVPDGLFWEEGGHLVGDGLHELPGEHRGQFRGDQQARAQHKLLVQLVSARVHWELIPEGSHQGEALSGCQVELGVEVGEQVVTQVY